MCPGNGSPTMLPWPCPIPSFPIRAWGCRLIFVKSCKKLVIFFPRELTRAKLTPTVGANRHSRRKEARVHEYSPSDREWHPL
jgi:hypothetical protein